MQRVFSYLQSDRQIQPTCNMTYPTSNGPAIVGNFVLSDNSTSAFVSNFGTFPSFTNVNVSTSGNPTAIVNAGPGEFCESNVTGFVGDPFPLRSGTTVPNGTPPTPAQYADGGRLSRHSAESSNEFDLQQ